VVGVDLDLRQVRAFVAVVDAGHFGRAAQSLSLTQQALSKRVARLEATLGPLLERGARGVSLTPAGERFLPGARRMLEAADAAVADVREGPSPPVRVDIWGELHPPARLVRAAVHEDPDLALEISGRRDLVRALAALERHEIDLAFGNVANLDAPPPDALSAELVTSDPLAVLVNARGPLAARDHLTPDDLARHGLWWPAAGVSAELGAFAAEFAGAIGATLTPSGTNLGLDTIVERVAADTEVIAPVAEAWPIDGRDGVRVVPLRPTPHYPWYAVWRPAGAPAALVRLLRAVRAAGTRPPPQGPMVWLPRGARGP
jgi:DNA-binding transcriptional LysR family regulator